MNDASNTKFEILSLDMNSPANTAGGIREQAERIVASAQKFDGVEALSEAFVRGLSDDSFAHRHLGVRLKDVQSGNEERGGSTGHELVGFAALAPEDNDGNVQAELVVAPEFRRQGAGELLLSAVFDVEPRAHVWAHGNLPAAQGLAAKRGLAKQRSLLVMSAARDDLDSAGGDQVGVVPEGFELANMTESVQRWGSDFVDEQWLTVNNDAFSWHPEQGGWSLTQLRKAREVDWFDSDDVVFLWCHTDSGVPSLAGFHWTKWHGGDNPATGEVYVIGVNSDFRGKRLGKPLLFTGINRMWEKGADVVILYVEADNQNAVHLYERSGFSVREEHATYLQRD